MLSSCTYVESTLLDCSPPQLPDCRNENIVLETATVMECYQLSDPLEFTPVERQVYEVKERFLKQCSPSKMLSPSWCFWWLVMLLLVKEVAVMKLQMETGDNAKEQIKI